jgi:hypothetical protein
MYYILEINNVLFNIYDKIDGNKQGLIHLFKLSSLHSNIVLKEYHNGYMKGVYRIKNNQILYSYSEKNKIITTVVDDLPFELLYNPTTNINIQQESSDIHVNLPVINTEIKITTDETKQETTQQTNEETKEDDEEIDEEELKKKIDELNKLKDQEMKDLEKLNEGFHEIENEIFESKSNLTAEKNKLKRDKEKWEEFKNIFTVDKKIYRTIKEKIEKGEMDETAIPELFEKKYPILKVLDENNILDTSSDIYEYIKLLPEDDSIYIPRTTELYSLFNDNPGVSSISLTEMKDTTQFETQIDTDDESE